MCYFALSCENKEGGESLKMCERNSPLTNKTQPAGSLLKQLIGEYFKKKKSTAMAW